jgi:hypothetical protein
LSETLNERVLLGGQVDGVVGGQPGLHGKHGESLQVVQEVTDTWRGIKAKKM